jgi:hypothetical protein
MPEITYQNTFPPATIQALSNTAGIPTPIADDIRVDLPPVSVNRISFSTKGEL